MFDTESYLYITKKAGLSWDELQMMDLGQVMDFIVEYANEETKAHERAESGTSLIKKANQADFDTF